MKEDLQTLDELLNRFSISLSDKPEEAKQTKLTKEDKKIIAAIYAVIIISMLITWLVSELVAAL